MSENAKWDLRNYCNCSSLLLGNTTSYYDDVTSSSGASWLITLVDRSQQVMTIIGVIANIVTSITLIKNGQVSVVLTL